MLSATHEQVRRCIKQYIQWKVPFTYTIQNETISVNSAAGSYTSMGREYTIDEINFIKKVKQYVVKNGVHLQFSRVPHKKVMYFMYSSTLKPKKVFTDCVNIDLTAAYWETAYLMGLIPPNLYREGTKHRKQVRLATIGSFAKKKRVYEFDGKKQSKGEIVRSETEHIWDVVCDKVGLVLSKTARACKNDFIFFWVDGIYIKKSSVPIVKKMFSAEGYKFKINPISKIEVTERNIFVYPTEGKRKPFVFRDKLVSNSFIGYNTDL